jgi:hypothetical protein
MNVPWIKKLDVMLDKKDLSAWNWIKDKLLNCTQRMKYGTSAVFRCILYVCTMYVLT